MTQNTNINPVSGSLTLTDRVRAELFGLDAKMCVYADDLRGTVIDIGADEVFESASTIKCFILGALFEAAARDMVSLDEVLIYRKEHYVDGSGMIRALGPGAALKAIDAATLMIICSDNIATNMLIDRLGLEYINAFTGSIGCNKTQLHRKLRSETWGQRLGSITPRDLGHFFTLLSLGELVSPEASARMRKIFRQQHYNQMITGALPPYYLDPETSGSDPDLIYTATKSGSMDECRNDAGLVHTPYGEYVISMMCTGFRNKLEVNDHPAFIYGQRVSRLLFDQYLAKEGHF